MNLPEWWSEDKTTQEQGLVTNPGYWHVNINTVTETHLFFKYLVTKVLHIYTIFFSPRLNIPVYMYDIHYFCFKVFVLHMGRATLAVLFDGVKFKDILVRFGAHHV